MALCPALGPYSTLHQEAGPFDELSEAQAQQLRLLAPPWTIPALVPGCRSFWDTLADPRPFRLYPLGCGWTHRLEGASPPWWWFQGHKRAFAPPSLSGLHSPGGAQVEVPTIGDPYILRALVQGDGCDSLDLGG